MNKEANEWTDRFGAVASSLCAIHCAICALLPVAFAALGVGFLLSHKAEWLLTLVAVLFGGFALNLAWRTHRSQKVMALLLVGILGLFASRGIEMGSEHDDHHGDEHHTQVEEAGEHHADGSGHAAMNEHAHKEGEDGHGDDHHGQEDEHHAENDGLHLMGAGVGVLSGLLLFFGHMLNIWTARRCREEGCD